MLSLALVRLTRKDLTYRSSLYSVRKFASWSAGPHLLPLPSMLQNHKRRWKSTIVGIVVNRHSSLSWPYASVRFAARPILSYAPSPFLSMRSRLTLLPISLSSTNISKVSILFPQPGSPAKVRSWKRQLARGLLQMRCN